MAPSNTKANYKTYEAQARLLRAVIAAHSDVKWNYKEIVACFGSDMTDYALSHRFRRLHTESLIVREARTQGFDMKDLPVSEDLPRAQAAVDLKNISKYFGQSTADGIQFQFRAIKKDAEQIRAVVAAGGTVANCLPDLANGGNGGGSSAVTTPMKTPAKTPSKAASGTGRTGARSGTGTKRAATKKVFVKRSESDMDDDDDDDMDDSQDYSGKDIDETPSKRAKTGSTPGQKNGTPSRRAATKAATSIANATQQLESSSDTEPAPPSIFGHVEKKPDPHTLDAAFKRGSLDDYLSGDSHVRYDGLDDMAGDGEI